MDGNVTAALAALALPSAASVTPNVSSQDPPAPRSHASSAALYSRTMSAVRFSTSATVIFAVKRGVLAGAGARCCVAVDMTLVEDDGDDEDDEDEDARDAR